MPPDDDSRPLRRKRGKARKDDDSDIEDSDPEPEIVETDEEEEEDDDVDRGPTDEQLMDQVVQFLLKKSSESDFDDLSQYAEFDRENDRGLSHIIPNKGNILHRLISDGDNKQSHLCKVIEFITTLRPHLLETTQMVGNSVTPIYQAITHGNFRMVTSLIKGFKSSLEYRREGGSDGDGDNRNDEDKEKIDDDNEKDNEADDGKVSAMSLIQNILARQDPINTCLHLAFKYQCKEEHLLLKQREEAIQSMVSVANDDIISIQDDQGMTPLHLAVDFKEGNIPGRKRTLEDLILLADRALGKPDVKGRSVFTHHLETRREYLASVESLRHVQGIRSGAPVAAAPVPVARHDMPVTGGRSTNDQLGKDKSRTTTNPSIPKESGPLGKKSHETRPERSGGGDAGGLPQSRDNPTRANQGARRDDGALDVKMGISRKLTFKGERVDSPGGNNKTAEESWKQAEANSKKSEEQKRKEARRKKKEEERLAKEENEKNLEEKRRDPEKLKSRSKVVQREIKLRCMRTRSPRETGRLLYGSNPDEIQVFLDFAWQGNISLEDFEMSFQSIKLDSILQYVAFPCVRIEKREKKRLGPDDPRPRKSANKRGRSDMLDLFRWLEDKGVRRIVKVIVNDLQDPAHTDETIVHALEEFAVEELHWMKTDLDPDTIYDINEDMREVYLCWSGNNIALRGWSEPEGLPRLKKLKTIYLDLDHDKNLEKSKKTLSRIKEFEQRLRLNGCDAKVRNVGDTLMGGKGGPTNSRGGISGKNGGHKVDNVISHKWLQTMDRFASDMDDLWRPTTRRWGEAMDRESGSKSSYSLPSSSSYPSSSTATAAAFFRTRLNDPVTVALIDDGVDVLDPSLQGKGQQIEGQSLSFDHAGDNEPVTSERAHPYYQSAGGHGTVMANMIFRVCPMARLYVIRMETVPGGGGGGDNGSSNSMKARIDPRSASAAIEAAVDKKVNIISMSWTVNAAELDENERSAFQAAVLRAQQARILMFCSSSDGGHYVSDTYPSFASRQSFFRIGAANPEGTPFIWAGSEKELDFVLPGVDVARHFSGGSRGLVSLEERMARMAPQTGSSVATALGAGLAALLLGCLRMAAMYDDGALEVRGGGGGDSMENGGRGGGDSSTSSGGFHQQQQQHHRARMIDPGLVDKMQDRESMNDMLKGLNVKGRSQGQKFLEVWQALETGSWAKDFDHMDDDGKLATLTRRISRLLPTTLQTDG